MNKSFRFSHKILLAASLIVLVAFTLFTLYNDYLQRNAIREDLENYLGEMGDSASTNIKNLFDGRKLEVVSTEPIGGRKHFLGCRCLERRTTG